MTNTTSWARHFSAKLARQRLSINKGWNVVMANEGHDEPFSELSSETRDIHRVITSLMEELEALDWYNQRVDACKNM